MQDLTQAVPMRERVERLEAILEQAPQGGWRAQFHFAPGIVLREMIIDADTYATGAVHKTEHLAIIAGHCLLTTDEVAQEFCGYHTVRSQPGAKRAIYAITTTVVTTIHPNPDNETDPAVLAERFTESKADELLGGPANRQALANAARTEVLQ